MRVSRRIAGCGRVLANGHMLMLVLRGQDCLASRPAWRA
jgi:hypothetical protein